MPLEPRKAYRIEGNFFKVLSNPSRHCLPTFFQGGISLDEQGNFQGFVFDKYGPSTVKGFTSGSVMEFSKNYDTRHKLFRGSGRQITYKLGMALSGGWDGVWNILGTENPDGDQGLVTLAIVPWNDDFPIMDELQDYLNMHPTILIWQSPTTRRT